MRPDDLCVIVALEVKMLSWLCILLLLCPDRTHDTVTGRRTRGWTKTVVVSLLRNCCGTAAVLLLYCCILTATDFVAATLRDCLQKPQPRFFIDL